MREKIVSKAVDENGDGLDVQRIVQVGSESTTGMNRSDCGWLGGVDAATPPNQLQRCILTDYFNNSNFSKLK
jgi:hypothetical protein